MSTFSATGEIGVTIIYRNYLRSWEIWVLALGSKTRSKSKKWDWVLEISEFFGLEEILKIVQFYYLIL